MSEWSVGDVVNYRSERADSWCREGMAVAQDLTRLGRRVLRDTYWLGGGDQHVLTDTEAASAELLFNVGDYDELDRYSSQSPSTWAKYAPTDRQVMTSQHGLQKRWFIRKGASEDWLTQIQNARDEVERREGELRQAQQSLEWAREDLSRAITASETSFGPLGVVGSADSPKTPGEAK